MGVTYLWAKIAEKAYVPTKTYCCYLPLVIISDVFCWYRPESNLWTALIRGQKIWVVD